MFTLTGVTEIEGPWWLKCVQCLRVMKSVHDPKIMCSNPSQVKLREFSLSKSGLNKIYLTRSLSLAQQMLNIVSTHLLELINHVSTLFTGTIRSVSCVHYQIHDMLGFSEEQLEREPTIHVLHMDRCQKWGERRTGSRSRSTLAPNASSLRMASMVKSMVNATLR